MYGIVFRQVILRMDPENAHRFAVRAFRWGRPAMRAARVIGLMPRVPASARVTAMGLEFPGAMGLAAGMDKNAESVRGLAATGFAFIEIGTVTAKGQPGNERPRSWREVDVRGLRNRMGFNNQGADAVARRLAQLRSRGRDVIVGVNIGKSKVTAVEDAAGDYGYSARVLAPYADYLVVNVSSPNTPGLRDLQSVDALRPILERVREAADEAVDGEGRHVPLLVKIAPDLADADVDAVAALVRELNLDGVVATNTTIDHDRGPGGLSGPPLRERAREVVTRLRAALGEGPVIMGVGGIESAADARALLDAGATLVQAYTGFVYGGPFWPARINRELAAPQ